MFIWLLEFGQISLKGKSLKSNPVTSLEIILVIIKSTALKEYNHSGNSDTLRPG